MSQTINDKPSLHIVPSFYGVYILQSIPKPRSTYIGSTPDPRRRLRQHNGDLKAGGAYKTKRTGFRPWKMIVLVYGFHSRVSALQFEHALQHSHQTRHINDHLGKSVALLKRFANAKLLLSSPSFNKMGLKMAIFDNKLYRMWNDKGVNQLQLRDFDQFCEQEVKDIDIDEEKQIVLNNKLECTVCNQTINYFPDEIPNITTRQELTKFLASYPLVGIHQDHCFHLSCIAKSQQELIPRLVNCTCGVKLNWGQLIRVATRMRAYLVGDCVDCSQ